MSKAAHHISYRANLSLVFVLVLRCITVLWALFLVGGLCDDSHDRKSFVDLSNVIERLKFEHSARNLICRDIKTLCTC